MGYKTLAFAAAVGLRGRAQEAKLIAGSAPGDIQLPGDSGSEEQREGFVRAFKPLS